MRSRGRLAVLLPLAGLWLLALGGLLVGIVGLVVGALAWGRRTAAPAARPDAVLTGAGKV